MALSDRQTLLAEALDAYRAADPGDVYDETLRTVSNRVVEAGSLCKADIGSLVLWKRITASSSWAGALGMTRDQEVRSVTGAAVSLANDEARTIPDAGQSAFHQLRQLPGLGGTGALASAVLVAIAPDRMAIWDRRVAAGLSAFGRRPKAGAGFYGRYLTELLGLAETLHGTWRPRDVELALFTIGGSNELLARAAS